MAEISKNELEAKKLIVSEVEKAIDLLEEHLKKYCDELSIKIHGQKSNYVPMAYISESVKILKQNYRKGAGL
jgi:TPP-dependent indolepyruvate ferredoxin oxidoreductase alpha subunit